MPNYIKYYAIIIIYIYHKEREILIKSKGFSRASLTLFLLLFIIVGNRSQVEKLLTSKSIFNISTLNTSYTSLVHKLILFLFYHYLL